MERPGRIGMCEISKDEIKGALSDEEENYDDFTKYSNVALLENSYDGVPEVLGQVEEPSQVDYQGPDEWLEDSFIGDEFAENISVAVEFLYEEKKNESQELPVVLNPEFL